MGILEQALAWLNGPKVQPSGIDRRRFLQFLGGTAVGAAVAPLIDVEHLLWTPKPMIVVPGADTWLSIDWITREALMMFENRLGVARLFNRDWDIANGQIGQSVSVQHRPVVLDHQYGVSMDVLRRPVDPAEFRRTFLRSAVDALVEKMPKQVVCGELAIPANMGGSRATKAGGGPSLRGIQTGYLDPTSGEVVELLRLDVLAGAV
jgi:hypothetical protein